MIEPQIERYFQLRLAWKLEVEVETKLELRRQVDELAEEICQQKNLSLSARDFFEVTRSAFIQWARRSR